MENVQHMLDGESAAKNWSVATESYLMHATRTLFCIKMKNN